MGFSLGSIGKSIGGSLGGLGGGLADIFNNERSMDYNSDEAAMQREFAMKVYKNRHQWEVEDLRKAGLNPILSANSGASGPSFASASAPFLANPITTAKELKVMDATAEKVKNEAQESLKRQ